MKHGAIGAIILVITAFVACSTKTKPQSAAKTSGTQFELYKVEGAPLAKGGDGKLLIGGFSGLLFDKQEGEKYYFTTHVDRGPNGEPEKYAGFDARRFPAPNFAPLLVKLELDRATRTLRVTDQITLKNKNGKPLTGLPNLGPRSKRVDADEIPLDPSGKPVRFDPWGLDLEAITHGEADDYWMAEEYRPSILHFSAQNILLDRYVPVGAHFGKTKFGVEVLPAHLKDRQVNRGFEGLAMANGKLYAFLQSPLKSSLLKKETELQTPIVEFDIATKKVTSEYTYNFEGKRADKIGDAVSIGNQKFLVIEQNSKTGKDSFHRIYEIDLAAGPSLGKKLISDFSEIGIDTLEKVEGIAIVDKRTLAFVTDNDFSVSKPVDSNLILLRFDHDLY